MADRNGQRARHFGTLLLAVAGCVALWTLPGGDTVLGWVEQIQSEGLTGALVLGVLYVVGCLAFMPVSVLTLACGFIYGPWWGFLLAWPCEILGALISYGLARTLFYRRARRRLRRSRVLLALDDAFEHDGGRLVFLIRLSPFVPFAALNYALGVSGVRPWPYGLASSVGLAPVCFLYVYTGASLEQLGAIIDGSAAPESGRATWIGLAATLVATVAVGRAAGARLHESTALEAADS